MLVVLVVRVLLPLNREPKIKRLRKRIKGKCLHKPNISHYMFNITKNYIAHHSTNTDTISSYELDFTRNLFTDK